jgi:hypothetical protein
VKYITAEVYKKMQRTDLHLLLQEDERAAEFSEDYFKLLFDEQKANSRHWLSRYEGTDYVLDENVVKHHREKMPDELFSLIADFRVFILGRATKEVIEKVTAFSEQSNLEMKQVFNQYYEYQKSIQEKYPKHVLAWFDFHDCTIGYYEVMNMVDKTTRLKVSINNLGGFTTISSIKFIDVKEHNINDVFIKSWLLYSEVHEVDEGYEFTYLTNKGEIKVVCSDIAFFEEIPKVFE